MANEVQDLVDRIVAASGDVDAADALARYNTAHKRMVARSLCYRKTADLGATVADQAAYDSPADLLVLLEVTVDGAPYGKMRHVDAAFGALGYLSISGPGGVFAEQHDDAGAAQIMLYPVPSSSGLAISAYGAFQAPTQAGADTPLVDSDFWDDIVDYALALGRERDDERQDAGAGFRATFDTACEELRRRVAKRYRGTGPGRIRILGINA